MASLEEQAEEVGHPRWGCYRNNPERFLSGRSWPVLYHGRGRADHWTRLLAVGELVHDDDGAMHALPDPPLWQSWLLEEPGDLCGLLVLVSAVCLVVAGWRRKRAWRVGCAVGILAAVGVWSLAGLVTTTREELIERSRAVVGLAQTLDTEGRRGVFLDGAELLGPGSAHWMDVDQIIRQVRNLDRRGLDMTHQVAGLRAQVLDAGTGVTRLDLRTRFVGGPDPRSIKTLWLLTWARDPGGPWRVQTVQWLNHPDLNGFQPRRDFRW